MKKYSKQLIWSHWIVAVLIILQLIFGFYMTSLPNTDPYKFNYYYMWHKSFGATILLLVIWRIIIRLTSKIPSLPRSFPYFEKFAANFGHLIFYILMVIMPLTGFLGAMISGYGMKFFGINIPNFFTTNKDLAKTLFDVHTSLPIIFIILIGIHILAWPYHYLKEKVNIIKRII